MRIGIDCRLWNETGVGRYIRNLVLELNKQDLENEYVLFVLSIDELRIKNYELRKNFRTVIADIRWHSLEEQLLLPEILKKEKLDLMHFPYFSVPIFYNLPFVVTIHDLIIDHYPTGEATTRSILIYKLKRMCYDYVIRQAVKKALKVIAVSYATEKEIIEHLHVRKEKIVVTYEGVNEKITNHKSQITNKLPNTKYQLQNTKYFLHVGNVYPHKNCDRLIEAFVLLRKKYPDMKLVFTGKDDFFFKKLREKVRILDLSQAVIFAGLVSDRELAFYYHKATAVVMPSFMEGFGLPAVEAMKENCLVLASDIPSLREVCIDAALYFDPKSANDIAKCMEKAVQLPIAEKQKLIKSGKQQSVKFSWEIMAKETRRIYEGCIGVRQSK